MSYFGNYDFYLKMLQGRVSGATLTKKRGFNSGVTTTPAAISAGGFLGLYGTQDYVYATSTDTNDTSSGTGARTITFTGMQGSVGSYAVTTETLSMNGTSNTSNSANQYVRVFASPLVTCGNYVTSATDYSQKGTISLKSAFGGGVTWLTIPLFGSSNLGGGIDYCCHSVIPIGYSGYVTNLQVTASAACKIYVFKRSNLDVLASAPYSPRIMLDCFAIPAGVHQLTPQMIASYALAAKDDFWLEAESDSGTITVGCTYDLIQIAN